PLLLVEPSRIQRVDRRERVITNRRRHVQEERIDVDHRPGAARAGDDRFTESFDLLGARVVEHGHRSRFSPESHFAQLAYSPSTSGPVSPGMSGLTANPFRVWR